jgi:hypothetical protein
MMRSKAFVLRNSVVITLALAVGLSSARAGDSLEIETTAGVTEIRHMLWTEKAFPLEWRLHQDGVVNNDSWEWGTPPVSNADTVSELGEAFQAWVDVPFSDVTVAYAGETGTSSSGCDLENVVTWSDSITWTTDVVASSVVTAYVGESLTLDDSNRSVPCGDSPGVLLDQSIYPNGSELLPGTILDVDITWNADHFDYVIHPNEKWGVIGIQSVATHEFGHMLGLSHTSLAYGGSSPATMFPFVDSTDNLLQVNTTTLEADDRASSGRAYPGVGFWPEGQPPHILGAISGTVLQSEGTPATGVRVWAYDATNPSWPVYETFSATPYDWDLSLSAGDYLMAGVAPGKYYVCILPWNNGVPDYNAGAIDNRYNETVKNGVGNLGFPTECYDDEPSSFNPPDQPSPSDPGVRRVEVKAGHAAPQIDFVTGVQKSDFMLIMDRSGSMRLPAGGTVGKDKLEALQDAAHAFIDYLDLAGGHRLGLVQFEEALVPLSPVFDLQALPISSRASKKASRSLPPSPIPASGRSCCSSRTAGTTGRRVRI